MPIMPPQFIQFVEEHNLLTLATSYNDEPYCSAMGYAFIRSEQLLVLSLGDDSAQLSQAVHNMCVAASIVDSTGSKGWQALQLQGMVYRPVDTQLSMKAIEAYLQRYPEASSQAESLWLLEPTSAGLVGQGAGTLHASCWSKDTLVNLDFLKKV